MVPRRAVRAAAAVQSDAEAGTRYRVDLVAAAESEKAAHPVTAAAPDALVVAAVPPVAVVAEPAAGAVELDAVVAVAGSAVAAAFSPFPGLFGRLERSQTCHRRTSRVLVQAPQTTRS